MATHSPAELALVQQLFSQADPNKHGIITGEAALQSFGKTGLPPTTLGEIWALADKDNNGFLTRKDAAIALRLIGHAQKGEAITEALANKPGPLAQLDTTSARIPQAPRSPVQATGSSSGLPPFTSEDKTKFIRIFVGAGPSNGLLSGDKARDIFLKSKLPFEKLSQIWQLADTQNRGSLDSTDFAIAMYFVRAAMSNPSLTLPFSLPPGLYEQAGGKPSSVLSHATGGSTGGLPTSPIGSAFTPSQPIKPQYTGGVLNAVRPQYTGQPLQPQTTGQRFVSTPLPSASGASPFPNAVRPQSPAPQFWDVSPQEKSTFDGFYRTLDTQNRGFIEGDIAVPFLLQSGLPEDVLASVWDLADMHNDGKLTQETFAVAMHLINGKLAGKPLPDRLPDSLIPPSQRQRGSQAAAAAPVSQIQRDLFELDNSPPGSPIVPEQATGGAFGSQRNVSMQNTGASNSIFPAIGVALPGSVTSSPPRSQQQSPFQPPAAPTASIQDLLGDDDDGANENAQIHTNAAEIGNLQNKLKSTQQSLKSSQEERKTLENTIAAQASQLSSLQSQLSTASAAYETEKKLLETLQERMNSQNLTIQKTREELIRKESELSALKLEKSEVEGNLLRDKEDVRQLEREMKEANEGSELIKTEIEKAKKEARQQKGRLAIAKKQLATSQAEREKAYQELETAKLELEQAHKEIESAQVQIESINAEAEKAKSDHATLRATSPPPAEVAAKIHIPDTPDVHSPSAASVKSTNPFEKLAMSTSSSKPTSPFQSFTTPLPGITPGTLPEASEKVTLHPGTEAVTAEDDDPFGFNEPAEEATPPQPEEEANAVQPTVEAMKSEDKEPKLEEDDSKAPNTPAGSPPVANQFPTLEDIGPTSPTKTEGTDHLDAAKEIEPVESDSSDDEDDVPLGALKATQAEQTGVQQPKLPPGLSNGSVATPGEPATVSAFDDIFAPATADSMEANLSNANAPVEPSANAFESTFGDISSAPAPAPSAQKEETKPSITAPAASGIDAFDEAMGKLTPTPAPAQSSFGFESNFGDTFDFGTSTMAPKEAPKPAPEAPTSVDALGPVKTKGDPSIPSLPPIATNSQPFSFDDAFGEKVSKATAQSNGVEPKAVNGESSFEDVFGVDESQAPKSPTTPTAAVKQSEDTQISPSRNNSSIGHGPSSPRTLERPTSPLSPDRTMSSTRSTSPPPRRPLSPSARKSSGSKAAQGEDKRSHKLSIRFFSRKKEKEKSKKGIQLPDSQLSPLGETQTPAADDDLEPLKALCNMGFSRAQALSALEENNYDMQRAINSLVGSQ